MEIDITSNLKDFSKDLQKLSQEGLINLLSKGVKKSSSFLITYIKDNHLTGGTTDTKLKGRSGRLRQSVLPLDLIRQSESVVEGGLHIGQGVKYAELHINETRKSTTITPKSAGALAIPLPGSPAVTPSGVSKVVSKIREQYPFLKRKGNVLADTRDGNFIPYFALKKSVTIQSRVHTDEILDQNKDKIASLFTRAAQEEINTIL